MSYTKRIKFMYYRPFLFSDSGDMIFSLLEIIANIDKQPLKSRIKQFGDNKYRLENIEREHRNNIDFCHLRFMKLDDANLPNLAYEDDRSVPLTLCDGQYLGTALHVLYDVTNDVLMVQQNRNGMGLAKINEYFNAWAHELELVSDSRSVELYPIYSTSGLENVNGYTKVLLKFANLLDAHVPDNSRLRDVISYFHRYEALSGSITIGVGHHTSQRLNSEEMRALSQDISENRHAIKSAQFHYKTEDYTGFVDLIENVMHDVIQFEIERRTVLSLINAQQGMLNRYFERLPDILKELHLLPKR